ncbi:site-specific integrase, partial [Acinetobacter baumannii]
MREFMGYLITERGYSEKTKDAYERDLNDFCQFLENSGDPSLTAVDHLDVR